jgi:penicillin-binding protein 1C
MIFEARGGAPGVRWVLDGSNLGPATAPVLWPPHPGRHRLALVDGDGRVHDTAEFVVRGPAARGE